MSSAESMAETSPGSTAKDTILAAVRAGLTGVPDTESTDTPVSRHYRRDRTVDDPVGRLKSRLTDIDVDVAVCTAGEIADRVGEALSKRPPGCWPTTPLQ